MKSKVFYIVFSLAILVSVLLMVFIISNRTPSSHTIELPPYSGEQSEMGENGYSAAEVTPETVKTVVSTIERPDGYHAQYTVTTYWDGGQSTTDYSLWQTGEKTLITAAKNGQTESTLINGQDIYIWNTAYGKVFKSTMSEDSNQNLDRFARLVTYEDLVALSNDDISAADYVLDNSRPCVFVEYSSGILNYETQLYVSAETGILNAAKISDGDTPIYEMSLTSIKTGKQPEDIFNPPTT